MIDSRERFSSHVADYVRYRPDYPDDLLPALLAQPGLDATALAADIGSGTGIFSAQLLRHGLEVYAVEPNAPMRAAAEQRLGGEARFHSVAASAEDTGLAPASVDLVTAALAAG